MKHVSEIDHTKMHFMAAGDDMLQITSPLTQFGIEYVGFSRVNEHHEESFLTSRVESAHIWYEGRFYEHLFCDDISKYSDTNVLWDQLADYNRYAANLFNTFSENAGIAHGISMVRKYDTYVDHFYFSGNRSNVNLSQFFLNNLDILDAFILYFYDKADHLIIEADANRIYTPGCQDTSLLTTQSASALRRSKINFMA